MSEIDPRMLDVLSSINISEPKSFHHTTPTVIFLLLNLSEDQRAAIFCWFCRDCHRYVGPGDSCVCMRDE